MGKMIWVCRQCILLRLIRGFRSVSSKFPCTYCKCFWSHLCRDVCLTLSLKNTRPVELCYFSVFANEAQRLAMSWISVGFFNSKYYLVYLIHQPLLKLLLILFWKCTKWEPWFLPLENIDSLRSGPINPVCDTEDFEKKLCVQRDGVNLYIPRFHMRIKK